MPYNKVEDLPDVVKNNLPIDAQRVWMSAFNFAYSKYKNWDEGRFAKYAWGVVSKRFKKNDKGEWVKLQLSFIDNSIDYLLV